MSLIRTYVHTYINTFQKTIYSLVDYINIITEYIIIMVRAFRAKYYRPHLPDYTNTNNSVKGANEMYSQESHSVFHIKMLVYLSHNHLYITLIYCNTSTSIAAFDLSLSHFT